MGATSRRGRDGLIVPPFILADSLAFALPLRVRIVSNQKRAVGREQRPDGPRGNANLKWRFASWLNAILFNRD